LKILHTADWHLGAYVGPQCDDPMKRMENTMKCLDVLVETARQEQPDIILIAGDLFHQAKVWSERVLIEVRTVADNLRALSHVAPVAVLYGTPTHESLQSHYALEEMTYGARNEIYFFTQPGIRTFNTKSGPIQIAGLPGFDKGHFRAQFPGHDAEWENVVFSQEIANIVKGLSAQVDSTMPSVLMAHHTVVGCELDNGTHVFQANEVVLDAATLDNSAFDLVCLGHIHKAQRVTACQKPVYYAGSVDADRFNDEGHVKGFYAHTIDKFTPRDTFSMFCPTPAREFLTIKMDDVHVKDYISKGYISTWEFTIDCGTVADISIKNKVVRILYTCDSETEKAMDKKKLERDLYAAGAYYVSEIRPEKVTAAVNRDRMTEKLTVEDCLQRYLGEKKMSPDDIALLFELAAGIIAAAQASSPIGTTSGLFLPVEIEVRNYRSYAEEKLSFEDIFFAMVNGKNGSGKSSLFMDAITDCLYEETREKELTGWIRNGEKSGSISFTFRLGDDLWRVTRTRQRSGKATLALAKRGEDFQLPFGDNANWEDHSCERFADTQEKIVDLLGMDCDTFQSCVLIMQDRYGKFMEASKEDRMNVLASLLGLGIYDELEKLAKDKLTDANRDVKNIKAEIASLEAEVQAEADLCTEKAQVALLLAETTEGLETSRTELTGYQAEMVKMDGYVQEATGFEKDVKLKTDSYTEKKNKRTDLQNRVAETESFLQNEQNILEKCGELDSTRLAIAAMDGRVQLLNDKKSQHLKASRELQGVLLQRTGITTRLKFINTNLQDRERLEAIVKQAGNIEERLEEMEKKAQENQNLDNALTVTKGQLTMHTESVASSIESRNYKLKNLIKQVEMLGDSNCIDVGKANCRFLQSAKQAQKDIEALKVEMTEIAFVGEAKGLEIQGAVDRLRAKITALEYNDEIHERLAYKVKEYRDAKDRLSKIAADAATADALNVQYIELGAKVVEFEKELNAIAGEIATLEKETGGLVELKQKVNSLLQYEDMKMQLPKAKQFVESSMEQISQLYWDIQGLQQAIDSINERLIVLQACTADKGTLKVNIIGKEQAIKTFESTVSTLNQQIGNINAKLEVISGQRIQLQEKQASLQQAVKQAAQLQVLVEAFSQDGIPYQIIRDIVPELEAAANEILGQMTGGKMRLEFVTEKVLKSNKAKEVATLEIIIIDVDNGVLPYLSRSGGQKVRSALSNSFALAMIKASRVGLQLGMLFIDEPSFLDADGIEGYCAALETIHSKYPEMRILAISHDENMKSRFPQQLYVDVTENGSRVRRL
jgi:exonuclease SbcD